MKKFLITEEERNNIKKLYNLVDYLERKSNNKKYILETKNINKVEFQNQLSQFKDTKSFNSFLLPFMENTSKLVLVFPGSWTEATLLVSAALLTRAIGIQVFWSVNECIEVLNGLSSKGKKYDKIYVGSHGGGKEGLLHTIIDKGKSSVMENFGTSLSKICIPNKTEIVFSACGGADDRYWLKQVAEKTKSITYGSEGVYDWVSDTSELGFWKCPVTPEYVDPDDLEISDFSEFGQKILKTLKKEQLEPVSTYSTVTPSPSKQKNEIQTGTKENYYCYRVNSIPFSW